MRDKHAGYLEHVVPHEMDCGIFSVYPSHSGKACDCVVKIVRDLEAADRTTKERLDEAEELLRDAQPYVNAISRGPDRPALSHAIAAYFARKERQ